MPPITPHRVHDPDAFRRELGSLNRGFGLEIPIPNNASPMALQNKKALRWKVYKGLKFLYYGHQARFSPLISNFDEWMNAELLSGSLQHKQLGTGRSRHRSEEPLILSDVDKERCLHYLLRLIDDERWMLAGALEPTTAKNQHFRDDLAEDFDSFKRPRLSDDEEELFTTAPNSPVKADNVYTAAPESGAAVSFNVPSDLTFNENLNRNENENEECVLDGDRVEFAKPSLSFLERLNQSVDPDKSFVSNAADTSFATSVASVFTTNAHKNESRDGYMNQSFVTDITEPETQSTYADSVVEFWIEEETRRNSSQSLSQSIIETETVVRELLREKLVNKLLDYGPFSSDYLFPKTVPLRARYELERIGRAWKVPLDKMLRGGRLPITDHDEFWKWIATHSARHGSVPERSSRKAWDSAVGDFKTDRHSEVVVLTGELEWCSKSEPGIFSLQLNPLKSERACRFHRRFGSDRFMSITMPAPTRPPTYLGAPSQPSILRQSIASWLTGNDHRCLGRIWRAFYVEEMKSKRKVKAEPRFRVEFFAIDGVDFCHNPYAELVLAAPSQHSGNHTPMSVESLLFDWHMPRSYNSRQSNCKLFQRIHLGMSKTFVSISVKPTQILHLRDDPSRTQVMNDGCALMSRAMAKEVCEKLGITGATPSTFQARIAGAKGLWMVASHGFTLSGFSEDDVWIQISDSQLKIEPHPQRREFTLDEEQLTFEVVNWAKPLHPVDLNIQLLAILDYGGCSREYIAELTRNGIRKLYTDFARVIETDSSVDCRALIQKLRPSRDVRLQEQWITDDAESIIRLCEAGFRPRSFYPLRKRLQEFMRWLVGRHVEGLHIQIPLSTYAYCIADPIGVLEPDEVHLCFSSNWRDPDGNFEDTVLQGIDVLVGRLPAHVPSDIQRRKAVWKAELRHFQDVIVFSSKGDIPLAHMLSGGDYDGDTPWICWDPNIVKSFRNSELPQEKPADHFGVTKHSVPMAEVKTTEEFLQGTFEFNLTMSNLGRCTVEHEKIVYDESINSEIAIELSSLLSHLVDGRKGGVHLSEQAWTQYRKTISPKHRSLPAYHLDSERRPKKSNIADYLKFYVAGKEREAILIEIEKRFPQIEHWDSFDEDLTRPWNKVLEAAVLDKSGDLTRIVRSVQVSVKAIYNEWKSNTETFSRRAKEAATAAKSIPLPESSHPLAMTWQLAPKEWQRILASSAYRNHAVSPFAFHAFADILCDLKAAASPSRRIISSIADCYRLDSRIVSQLAASTVASEMADGDEYKGGEAIEELSLLGELSYLDDGFNIE
ncbi:RNA-directed RNA polymerase [Penicillium taxi]|uniref:RNA-directed RNA polymerase n=1 Tax=Penicillium taxi TaxID=168475 RepID=UPI0025457F30|nr:RNA-directed RNA polymerase [Penicillium taxi]KAJ5908260.1 RNA-directed RNA polymerase [Penicillium taxi]